MQSVLSRIIPSFTTHPSLTSGRARPAYALGTLSLDQSRPEVRNIGIKDLISLSPSTRSDRQALLCSTDARTPKVLQLVQNPRCSLSTWVPEELLQIRIQAMARTYSSQGWIGGEEAVSGVEVDMKRLRREMWRSESFHGRTRAWHANPTPGTDLEGSRDGWTEQLAVSTAQLEVSLFCPANTRSRR